MHQKIRREMKQQLLEHIKISPGNTKGSYMKRSEILLLGSTSLSLARVASPSLFPPRSQLKYSFGIDNPNKKKPSTPINNERTKTRDRMTCRNKRATLNITRCGREWDDGSSSVQCKTRVRKRELSGLDGWFLFSLFSLFLFLWRGEENALSLREIK